MEKRLRKPILILLCFFSLQMWAQQKEVSGVVQDEDGMPLPGVNVYVKNTNRGTVTDFDGEFSLSVPEREDTILVFSMVGFTAQEIPIGNESTFNVTLGVDTQGLEEVVVTALGIKQEKKALGYTVTEVEGAGSVDDLCWSGVSWVMLRFFV